MYVHGADLSTASHIVGFVVGVLELALAAIVVRHLARFGRAFPWLAALLVFFVLRGIARIYETFATQAVSEIELVLDGFIVLIVVLLIAGLERTVAGLRFALDDAEFKEREYERAIVDYHTLARHRLANPLTTILGTIEALELEGVDAETQRRLLDNMRDASLRLRHVALDPQPSRPEEQNLHPRPARRRTKVVRTPSERERGP